MKNYECECGAPLDIDDGVLCVACFVSQHAKPPKPDLNNFEQLKAWLMDPKVSDFFEAVQKEIAFQKASWVELDEVKTPAHWFWLVAHLTSKALNAKDKLKADHHKVTACACLYLWLESGK